MSHLPAEGARQLAAHADLTPRHHPPVRAFGQRRRDRGRAEMVILCAFLRKLPQIVFGVLKSQKPGDPSFRADPSFICDLASVDEEVVLAMAEETEAAASEYPERREALRGCMAKLKDGQRELVHAHYIGGRTLREIAAALQRSESAIKMTMLRLRQQLSQCIQRQLQRQSP